MSEEKTGTNDLQFDSAEYAGPKPSSVACKACQKSIDTDYYELGGQIFCEACKAAIDAAIAQRLASASPVGALAAGLAGAVAGALIYGGIMAGAKMELGLVAILSGWLVGAGTKWGSRGKGGAFYQGMAVLLTYLSVSLAYFGAGMWQLSEQAGGLSALISMLKLFPTEAKLKLATAALKAPIEQNLDSPMGLIIVLIALYQAFAMNRAGRVLINGPYPVASAPAGGAQASG